jgi:hypothetical protein
VDAIQKRKTQYMKGKLVMHASSQKDTVEPHSTSRPGTLLSARLAANGSSPEIDKSSSRPKTRGAGRAAVFSLLVFLALLAAGPARLLAVDVNPGTTYQFTSSDNCDCDGTPFVDTVFKGTLSNCELDKSRAEAAAILSVSAINLDVTAFDTLYTCFFVPGTKPTVLDATVSADIDWDGILFGAGVLGAGASVEVDLYLVDETAGVIKANIQVMKKSQDSTGLKGIDVGGTHVTGSQTVSMQGTVVRGHQYSVRLKVITSAETGLIGVDVGSIFAPNVFGLGLGDHYVRWTKLAITVNEDISEKLDQLLDGQAQILQGQDKILQGQAEIKQAIAEHDAAVQNLLLTPQGRRPGFPLKPNP